MIWLFDYSKTNKVNLESVTNFTVVSTDVMFERSSAEVRWSYDTPAHAQRVYNDILQYVLAYPSTVILAN